MDCCLVSLKSTKMWILLDADHTPVPLAVIIIGRDVLLGISAFYWRYISLPPPVSCILGENLLLNK